MKKSQSGGPTQVNIATLKAQLAKYLRLVRSGRDVVVTDHKLPVARLIPFEAETAFETIKPEGAFSRCARLEIPPLENNVRIDSLAFLRKERGSR
jgi:prevent-host-death family protein